MSPRRNLSMGFRISSMRMLCLSAYLLGTIIKALSQGAHFIFRCSLSIFLSPGPLYTQETPTLDQVFHGSRGTFKVRHVSYLTTHFRCSPDLSLQTLTNIPRSTIPDIWESAALVRYAISRSCAFIPLVSERAFGH